MMVHCWVARYEADGYDSPLGWLANTDLWGDDAWDTCHAICVLADGHEGPHEFTPTSNIVISFKGAQG